MDVGKRGNEPGVDWAVATAEDLAIRVGAGEVDVWARLDEALAAYEAETGGSASELLPPEAASLGFGFGVDRAREFARKALCNRSDDARAPVEAAVVVGGPPAVGAIAALLSLPVVAPVVVTIAAILAVRGLGDFCREAAEE